MVVEERDHEITALRELLRTRETAKSSQTSIVKATDRRKNVVQENQPQGSAIVQSILKQLMESPKAGIVLKENPLYDNSDSASSKLKKEAHLDVVEERDHEITALRELLRTRETAKSSQTSIVKATDRRKNVVQENQPQGSAIVQSILKQLMESPKAGIVLKENPLYDNSDSASSKLKKETHLDVVEERDHEITALRELLRTRETAKSSQTSIVKATDRRKNVVQENQPQGSAIVQSILKQLMESPKAGIVLKENPLYDNSDSASSKLKKEAHLDVMSVMMADITTKAAMAEMERKINSL
ncbi:ty3-gypsy retrotransposon protein [Cucumis melo var. makuwa]|uniref:Ty3-gypsy retrotransposon protein n=1 Tax=Cucumis melo var. makuwa TaxID=1194695 RepID=A0A5D3CDV7_CUCMM|nr:ty3-gypsy retrotransposon protein [Cucumis melo var. makuwa]